MRFALALLTAGAIFMSGCTQGVGGDSAGENVPSVEATATTGGIRGVVVDERIAPVKGVLVEVVGTAKSVTTGEDGLFVMSGLEAGAYTVRASHALYASTQQTTEVVAGESEPKSVKIQLIRTVFATPYYQTLQYDGFIVCSVNLVVVLSEEWAKALASRVKSLKSAASATVARTTTTCNLTSQSAPARKP